MHWHHLISALLAVLRADALACVIAASERSVRKRFLPFVAVKAFAVSHRSGFCSGLAAARYRTTLGRADVLACHRLPQPRWQGQTFAAQRGLGLQSTEAAGFLQKLLFVLLPP